MLPEFNLLAIVVAAIIPNVLGMIWYGPLFGKAWLNGLGKTSDEMKPKNPAVVYILAFIMAFMSAFFLKFIIEMAHKALNENGELIFDSSHTFGHGAFHGFVASFLVVVPILVSMSLFHKIKPKVILMNAAFWLVCFALMGGVVDSWV